MIMFLKKEVCWKKEKDPGGGGEGEKKRGGWWWWCVCVCVCVWGGELIVLCCGVVGWG